MIGSCALNMTSSLSLSFSTSNRVAYLYGINTAGGMYADFDSSNAERNRETVHFNFPKHAHNNGNAYFGFFFSSHLLIDIVIIIRGRIPQYTNNSK